MAAFERLMLLIDADGKGAIREIGNVAKATDKLSASEKKLDRVAAGMVTIGSAAVAAGAVAGLGLAKAAKAAGDLEAAVSTTEQVFGAASGDIQSFAANSAKNFGLSKRAANEAAVGFGAFAKQAGLSGKELSGFSIDLLKLGADLSAFKNVSVDEAVQALTSGLAGESEPLRRFGIDVRDVALKAEYAAQTGEEFTGTLTQQQKVLLAQSAIMRQAFDIGIIDQFSREQGQLGTSLAVLQAQWEDAMASFGESALPVATNVVEGLTAVIDKFGELNETTDGAAGTLATYATGISLVGGSLLVVGGQLIKFRNTIREVAAAGALLKGGIPIAVAFGITAGTATLVENMTGKTRGLDKALQELQTTVSGGQKVSLEDFFSIADSAPVLQSTADKILAPLAVARELVQKELIKFGDDLTLSERDIEYALRQIGDATGAEGLKQFAGDVRTAREAVAKGSSEYKGYGRLLEEINQILPQFAENNVAGSDAVSDSGDAAADAANGYGDLGTEIKSASESYQEFLDVLRAQTDPFFAALEAADSLADAQDNVAAAMKKVAEEGATPENLRALDAAQRDAVESGLGLQGTLGDLATKLQNNEISSADALAALDSLKAQFPQLSGVVDATKQQFILLAEAQGGVDRNVDVDVKSNAPKVTADVNRLVGAASLVERTYTMTVQLIGAGIVESTLRNIESSARRAAGNIQATIALGRETPIGTGARGGFTSFAAGGMMLPGMATIQPGQGRGLIQWAEGETGGEAFIPLGPSKRKRSKDIWWETGRRLGVIQMANGGFSSDEPWGQYAEAMENAWQVIFDSSPLKKQVSLALQARDGYAKFSDQWVRFNNLLKSTKDELARQSADLKNNEFEFNYERSTPQNQLLLAQQRLRGQVKFSDEWVRWTEEIERIRADMAESLTPRAVASGGRSRGGTGGAPFYLTVNVNAEGLVTDPMEVGRQVVGAIKSYEQANGTTWRS